MSVKVIVPNILGLECYNSAHLFLPTCSVYDAAQVNANVTLEMLIVGPMYNCQLANNI